MTQFRFLSSPLVCALLLCVINAMKPPVVDDTAYLWFARQIQQTPSEPFGPPPDGFPLIWYYQGQGAFTLLIPMVVPYWLAVGMRLFGDNPTLLKLWLFPFCLLFTSALAALLRRFAPGWERRLLVMTVFSPSFLPSVNLMIDLPAIALGIAAIALFLRAMDAPRTPYFLVTVSGLLAGLAAQTKYNAVLATGVIFLAGLLCRKRLPAVLVVLLSLGVFSAWEAYLHHVYGRSHFLSQLEARREKPVQLPDGAGGMERFLAEISRTIEKKSQFVAPLIGNLGGLMPALALLAAVALRVPRWYVRSGIVCVVLGFVLMAIVPNTWAVYSRDDEGEEEVTLGTLFVSVTGISLVVAMIGVIGYLGFRRWSRYRPHLRYDPATWLLIGWTILELGGYFMLSPFPAARRSMGLALALTLLVGRLLSRTCRAKEAQRLANGTIILGVLLGILFAVVDLIDALPEAKAPGVAVDWIRHQPGGDTTIWFAGHWGFQDAAERAGAKTIFPELSGPKPGDWLILPEGYRPHSQWVEVDTERADPKIKWLWNASIGLRTIPDYYCGYMPLRHHEAPRVVLTIWRIRD